MRLIVLARTCLSPCTRLCAAFLLAALAACSPHADDHDHGVDDHAADHPHGAEAGHDHAEGEDEGWAVTAWGSAFEVFAEADPLVVGETASSHTHVTVLDGFAALTEGSVAAVLRSAAGEEVFESTEPVRPGIFNVAIVPRRAGEHELLFRITTAAAAETVPAGRVRVGEADDPGGLVADEGASHGAGEPVSFLKEQQWRIPFATAAVEAGSLAESVRGFATVRPVAGGEIVLTAPIDAVVLLPEGGPRATAWPYPGREVAAGEVLFRLAPRLDGEESLAMLASEVRVFEAELALARERHDRLGRLFAVDAVSRREVDEAEAAMVALEARLDAARTDLETARATRERSGAGETVAVTAPWGGAVAEVAVTPGQTLAAGTSLGRLVRTEPLWLEVRLRPHDAGRLDGEPRGLVLGVPGRPEGVVFAAGEVRRVSLFPEVDPATGTVGLLLELRAARAGLRPGATVEAEVLLPAERDGIVVPVSALVDDGGVAVVYVQLDGESFARREVEVTARQGGLALVTGLAAGERLVTRGGDQVRRSTLMAGGGDHGHVH